MFITKFPPPHKLAALLLLAVLAVPAGAQMPTVSLYNTGGSYENLEGESGIELRGSTIIPSGTEARVLVSTVSGYQYYFRNHGVQTYLAMDSTLSDFNGNVITFRTDSADMNFAIDIDVFTWPDDRIDSGGDDTTIELTLMSVAGFRVDQNNATATFRIVEDDTCSNPGEHTRNGNLVYRFRNGNINDSCVCTTLAAVMAAYGESATYLKSSSKWRTDNTDYCEDSPYQGLSNIDCTGNPLCTD